jgi:Chromo (CHRromatin Organisation MOdifier) domain
MEIEAVTLFNLSLELKCFRQVLLLKRLSNRFEGDFIKATAGGNTGFIRKVSEDLDLFFLHDYWSENEVSSDEEEVQREVIESDIYEVEAILDHRVSGANHEFLVKWKGFPVPSN